MTSANSIISNFLFPNLTPISKITAEPTFQSAQTACTKLNINLESIFTQLGGGIHGPLALVMTNAKYTSTTSIVAFFVPINPDIAPIHSDTSTMAQIYDTTRIHGENHRAFQLYHNLDKALRNHIIKATPSTFLQELQDPILILGKVICLQMLMNFHKTYGKIT